MEDIGNNDAEKCLKIWEETYGKHQKMENPEQAATARKYFEETYGKNSKGVPNIMDFAYKKHHDKIWLGGACYYARAITKNS